MQYVQALKIAQKIGASRADDKILLALHCNPLLAFTPSIQR